MEVWKDIKGYEKCYQISNFGRVKSLYTGKMLAETDNGTGYKFVYLKKAPLKPKHCYIHRLVAETFINEIPKDLEVNHINGVRSDNRLENLELVTRSENLKHSYDLLGRKTTSYKGMNLGGKNGNASAVCIPEYGLIFESIADASRFFCVGYSKLKAQVNGQNTNKYNLKYI